MVRENVAQEHMGTWHPFFWLYVDSFRITPLLEAFETTAENESIDLINARIIAAARQLLKIL